MKNVKFSKNFPKNFSSKYSKFEIFFKNFPNVDLIFHNEKRIFKKKNFKLFQKFYTNFINCFQKKKMAENVKKYKNSQNFIFKNKFPKINSKFQLKMSKKEISCSKTFFFFLNFIKKLVLPPLNVNENKFSKINPKISLKK